MKLLGKAFIQLDPKGYALTAKFEGLSKAQRRDLLIQIFGDPVYNMRIIHSLVNESTTNNKKKLKLLEKLYGKRWFQAMGAALTVYNTNSDCIFGIFKRFTKLKKKRQIAKALMAYAEAYKRNKSKFFRIDEDFVRKYRKYIKALKYIDYGYRKAFKVQKAKVDAPPKKFKRDFGDDIKI